MGYYSEHVVPRLIDWACGMKTGEPIRERACRGLTGEVVELGFGSGLNIRFYPPEVDSVAAVEPSDVAWRMAADRVAGSRAPVRLAARDGQRLPFADASFDSALSTWTLCTIPDAQAALREIRRVLRPGGVLRFVEHGLAPEADQGVRRWQHRLDPIQQRAFAGCHLDRPIVPMITNAGFTVTDLEVFYEPGAPRILAADSLGSARVAA
ncbi:methyltransferase domain-containing protein [Kitasatospora sp. NPDC048365]|uniref:class I SAM-dependent methyltransferase n=1 Tax=Kitasatospora sp. NPDC048365 TaxID=3364050 RepID=UPI0037151399